MKALGVYISKTDDPTLVGFCANDPVAVKYHITKDNLYDWSDFSEHRRLAITKQEAYLLKGATRGQLNASVAIFRLKQPQHGYSDRQEIDHTSAGQPMPLLGGSTLLSTESKPKPQD